MSTEDPTEGLLRETLTEEHSSFDELSRGLATGALSRSQALRLAGAALLGGALGILGLASPAQAKKRRRRRSGCAQGTRDAQTNAISCAAGNCLVHPDGGTSGCCLSEASCQQIAGLVASFDCTCPGAPPPPPPPGPPPPPPPPPCSAANPCGQGQCCSNGQCVSSCPTGQTCATDHENTNALVCCLTTDTCGSQCCPAPCTCPGAGICSCPP